VELAAAGDRVHVRTVRPEDDEPYRRAVEASADRIRRWNPVDPGDLAHRIATQSVDNRTFFVFANAPVAGQPLVGRINLTGAVRGRFRSVAMGYDSYDPYAGKGLFADGLRLVVDLALADVEAGGMGLHRVEASVQPGNVASAGLLRSLGFRHEGRCRRMLYLADATGHEAWRDQERYAVTREEWPAPAYAAPAPDRLVVWLAGADDAAGRDLAARLGLELLLPVLPAGQPGLAELLAGCPAGAVVRAGAMPPLPSARLVDLAERAATYGVTAGWDPRSVTRLALELRAGGPTGT
jgi:ribosomal-protein-alanine N-acetyltransferase